MKPQSQIKEFWVGLMAGVFIWLAVGALINFHQQHVFGKSSLVRLDAAVSLKKEDQTDSLEPLPVFLPADALCSPLYRMRQDFSVAGRLHGLDPVYTPAIIAQGNHPLRAPPIA